MEVDFRVSKANIYCIVNAWGGIAVHALGTILGCILRFYEKAYGECVEIGTNRISFDGVILKGSTWKYHSICCGQTIHMNMISFFFHRFAALYHLDLIKTKRNKSVCLLKKHDNLKISSFHVNFQNFWLLFHLSPNSVESKFNSQKSYYI